jgi:hypothetical protein
MLEIHLELPVNKETHNEKPTAPDNEVVGFIVCYELDYVING